MTSRRIAKPLILVFALGVALAGIWLIMRQFTEITNSTQRPVLTGPNAPGANEVDRPEPNDAQQSIRVPQGCPFDPQPIANPVSMTLIAQGLDFPMISVGLAADGSPGTPPDDEGYTVAWYSGGPLLGSSQGKAVLTSHTFRNGGALGNKLNLGLLKPGDIVRFNDAGGNSACYRYTGNQHLLVADYDPQSDLIYAPDGAAQFALIVCSDYVATGEAIGRVIYFGQLITGPLADG
ncbi:MAG: class F sortase [Acidobacteriota bacterium]|nr:class F sortase [Acidobacteriota bacterium]NLH68790.1 class F sortase [Brooklawnia sp.]